MVSPIPIFTNFARQDKNWDWGLEIVETCKVFLDAL